MAAKKGNTKVKEASDTSIPAATVLSETQRHSIGLKLDAVALDLCAARRLVHELIFNEDGAQYAADLSSAIDAIIVRCGRTIEQCAKPFGQGTQSDWSDYESYVFSREDRAAIAAEVSHG